MRTLATRVSLRSGSQTTLARDQAQQDRRRPLRLLKSPSRAYRQVPSELEWTNRVAVLVD